MFRNLKNKIKVDLEKEQASTNGSLCSSRSSSRLDLSRPDLPRHSLSGSARISEEQLTVDQQSTHSSSLDISGSSQRSLAIPPIGLEQTPSKDEPNQKQAGDVRRVSVSQKPDFSDSVSNTSRTTDRSTTNGLEKNYEQLLQENGFLREKLNGMQTLASKADLLEKENSIVLKELRTLRTANQELSNRNEQLKRSNVDNEERNQKLLNKMDGLKEKSRQLIEKNEGLIEKNRQMGEKQQNLMKNIDHLELSLAKVSKEKLALEEQLELRVDDLSSSLEPAAPSADQLLIAQLQEKLAKLEENLSEKNKTIRLQNQRIHDIKKSVQKGDLFVRDGDRASAESDGNEAVATTADHAHRLEQLKSGKATAAAKHDPPANNAPTPGKAYQTHVSDINFQYLHNVIFKFVTTYDPEAQKQLVKAISTLLKFTEEEERLVKQSLVSRNSWFRLPENFKF